MLKHIAHTPHGMNELRFRSVVDFRAQPPDGHFDDVGIAIEIDIPHLFGDGCATTPYRDGAATVTTN